MRTVKFGLNDRQVEIVEVSSGRLPARYFLFIDGVEVGEVVTTNGDLFSILEEVDNHISE